MTAGNITLIAGIISCVIGIATFIAGMKARASKEGMLEQKIEQALQGIQDIKAEVKANASSQNAVALLVNSHDERIKTLFNNQANLERHFDSLDNRTNIILHKLHAGGPNEEQY